MDIGFILNTAKQSECTRRKYGAAIVGPQDELLSLGFNKRVGNCCKGVCVRDRLQQAHGTNTDAGAEIHAEQAALINYNHEIQAKTMYIAGLDAKGQLLKGFENRPCYSCARMIAYLGLTWIYLPIDGDWQSVNIYDVMENWEQQWYPEN